MSSATSFIDFMYYYTKFRFLVLFLLLTFLAYRLAIIMLKIWSILLF